MRAGRMELVGRVDRIAAKLLTLEEYLRLAGPIHPPGGGTMGYVGDPAKRVLWIVAVSGEVYPNGRTPVFFGGPLPPRATPYPPYASGLFIVDAAFGGVSVAMADERAPWPEVFDRLPDHPAVAYAAPSATPALAPIAVWRSGGEAMSIVQRRIFGAPIDRLEYKLMTWGELERGAGAMSAVTRGAGDPVWVVAVAGAIPALETKGTDTWQLSVVDALSRGADAVIAVREEATSAWPPFFDALPDHPAVPLAAPTR